jgi:hypothetical protein
MLLWCVLLLVVMHRAPFPRVWLFLLPLAALPVGFAVFRALERWRPRTAERDAATTAVAIALGLSALVIRSGAVPLARETGTLRDAEAIATSLGAVIRRGDHVIAPSPSNAPLQYYFIRQGLDTSVFSPPSEVPPGAYLIINTGEGFSTSTPINHPLLDYFPSGRLLARFPEAEVYQLVR